MWRLKREGYVKTVALDSTESDSSAWALTRKGFDLIRSDLPRLVEGFQIPQNRWHDVLVTAIHLGPYDGKKGDLDFFSEQELRSVDLDSYPSWVPRDNAHRSDGYWKFKLGSREVVAALEVELHQKPATNYHKVAEYYFRSSQVARVVWVVHASWLANFILKTMAPVLGAKIGVHNFLLLEDVLKSGWDAKIIEGVEKGKTLSYLLGVNVKHYTNIYSPNVSVFSSKTLRNQKEFQNFSKKVNSLTAPHSV
jgi:hypothetical protein